MLIVLTLAACGAREDISDIVVDATQRDVETDALEDDSAPVDAGSCFDADAGTMPCGDASCNANTDFCAVTMVGIVHGGNIYSCGPLAAGCHDCTNVQINPGCGCSEDAGRILVVCEVP